MLLYLLSELDAPRMADFELHVQQCPPCVRELEYSRNCDDLLRDACLKQPDYHLTRARLCDLPDKPYVHLVYKNDVREISIYLRLRNGHPAPQHKLFAMRRRAE